MAQLNESFSIDTLPESQSSFDPLPAGWYATTIKGAELRTTKNGSGQYIAVKYQVNGPTHVGRIVFGNLNIRNQNQKAEEIGRMELGNLMRAIGLVRVSDTDELIGRDVQIKLTIREQEGYDPSNDVKGYKPVGGSAPAANAMPSQPMQQSAPKPVASKAPWAK